MCSVMLSADYMKFLQMDLRSLINSIILLNKVLHVMNLMQIC